MAADKVAAAIAATAQPVEQRIGGTVTLSTGRRVVLNMPADLSEVEFTELLGRLAMEIRPQMRAARRPGHRILIPT